MDDAHRTATLLEIVYPGQTNSQGTLFGGHALSLMDRLSFILASRYTRKAVVTACTENIEFMTPVKEGELVNHAASLSNGLVYRRTGR